MKHAETIKNMFCLVMFGQGFRVILFPAAASNTFSAPTESKRTTSKPENAASKRNPS